MAKKQLHCEQCSKFMGTINDGKISKGMKVVCTKCFDALITTPDIAQSLFDTLLKEKAEKKTKYDKFSDLFGDN